MKIPEDAEVSPRKLTGYLLVPRVSDDKSRFLAQAGFTAENPDELLAALRRLAIEADAVEDGSNEYGTFYRADGALVGPEGSTLAVATIWLRRPADGLFHFVTLKPSRRRRS